MIGRFRPENSTKQCTTCGKEIRLDAKGTWYHREGTRVECIVPRQFSKAEPA